MSVMLTILFCREIWPRWLPEDLQFDSINTKLKFKLRDKTQSNYCDTCELCEKNLTILRSFSEFTILKFKREQMMKLPTNNQWFYSLYLSIKLNNLCLVILCFERRCYSLFVIVSLLIRRWCSCSSTPIKSSWPFIWSRIVIGIFWMTVKQQFPKS